MRKEELLTSTVSSFGLVKLEEQSKKVNNFVNTTVKVGKSHSSSASIDSKAWHHGMQDGKNVNLHKGETLR